MPYRVSSKCIYLRKHENKLEIFLFAFVSSGYVAYVLHFVGNRTAKLQCMLLLNRFSFSLAVLSTNYFILAARQAQTSSLNG